MRGLTIHMCVVFWTQLLDFYQCNDIILIFITVTTWVQLRLATEKKTLVICEIPSLFSCDVVTIIIISVLLFLCPTDYLFTHTHVLTSKIIKNLFHYYTFFLLTWVSGQLAHTSTNPTGPEVNGHVSL
jgi:hypothetical protein